MSRMLNLCDHLLQRGKRLQELGRTHDALTVFNRLSSFRQLPPNVAEQAQVCLAEIQLHCRRPEKARRHLIAALAHHPNNARYHYLMATSLRANKDAAGSEAKAAKHYRRSLELDPNQADCLAEYGLFNVRRGLADAGLVSLRKAWQQTSEPKFLAKLVKGFRLSRRWKDARKELRAALFQHPRDGRFRKLWNDFRFAVWCRKQRRLRKRQERTIDFEPTILKFPETTRESSAIECEGKVLRHDSATPLNGPRHLASRPDQRHVQ